MQFTVNLSRSKIMALIFVLSIAISLFVGVQVGVAQSSSLTAPTISGGIYPGAPSYTVFTENGIYYAKNANGVITSNVDFAALTQSLIAANVVIYLADNQVFSQTSPININVDGVTIKSESAEIDFSSSSTSAFILGTTAGASTFQMKGIQLHNVAGTGNTAIYSGSNFNSLFTTISDCVIYNFSKGVVLNLGVYANIHDNYFMTNYIGVDDTGLGGDHNILNNHIDGTPYPTGSVGIYIRTGGNIIKGNHIREYDYGINMTSPQENHKT